MRVDEKEDWLEKLCDEYGLRVQYSWGRYYISFGVHLPKAYDIVVSRTDFEGFSLEQIEEIVLGYILEHGL